MMDSLLSTNVQLKLEVSIHDMAFSPLCAVGNVVYEVRFYELLMPILKA